MGNAPAPDVVIDPYRSFKVWIVPISIWMDATNRKIKRRMWCCHGHGELELSGLASWEGRTELPLRSR
jgi:hypothetical protein